MNTWKWLLAPLAAGLCFSLGLMADEPKADGATLVVVDGGGKEQKLKAWKFTTGVRPLAWLAPAPAPDNGPKGARAPARPKTAAGPEALEFREENSTTFVDGILTLVPLERIRAIEYDDKDGVTVRVAAGEKPEADELLKGTTKYKGINKLTIEAEVDKGDLGIAEIKYQGGVAKGIRSVRFPDPKCTQAGQAGRTATVTANDPKQKGPHKVADLQALYRFADGSEQLAAVLLFKKTLKLEVGKLQKLRLAEGNDADGMAFAVTMKDGNEETFTLLKTVTLDGKPATLEGLLGRVPAGYKLFPLHTLAEVQFEDAKPEK